MADELPLRLGNLLPILQVARQLARYSAAGLGLNALLYLFYIVITALGLDPFAASTLIYLIGIPLSFAAHRRFTFMKKNVTFVRKLLFVASYLFGYVILLLVLTLLQEHVGLNHQVSQLIAIITVAVFLFTFQKICVFRA